MTNMREYLVALDVRSTLHAWIAAEGEDEAIQKAGDLCGKDDTSFIAKDGGIESVMVLESRAAKPKLKKRFAVAFEQPVVHRITVEADDINDAHERATRVYLNAHGFFTNDPPKGWERTFGDWDIVEAEEVQEVPATIDNQPGPEIIHEVLFDVAHVTFSMHEALSEHREDLLPSGYRYHVFGGFPGFCSHAAEAGYALSKAFADLETDTWPEITDDFAGRVIAGAVASGYPLARSELASIAATLRDEALRDGAAEPKMGRRP